MESTETGAGIPSRQVGVWLRTDVAAVFHRHVGTAQGARGKYGAKAIEEQLRRDGAFSDQPDAKLLEMLRSFTPRQLEVLGRVVRVLSTAPEAIEAKLSELEEPAFAGNGGAASSI